MYDLHMHSRVSFDAESDPTQMALAAKAAGLSEICFTDHMDYSHLFDHESISYPLSQYRAAYDGLSVPGLTIRHGMELGLTCGNRTEAAADARAYPYDFIIGSIHFVDGLDIYYPEFWEGKTVLQAEERYFETMLECIRLHDDFDVLGHLTYVSKSPCNPAPRKIQPEDHRALTDEILATLVKKGKGLEINTSGIDKIGEPFPGPGLLRRFRELGGRIVTVGSDAHTPDRVGKQIPQALAMAKEIFGCVCTFSNREPVFHSL